MSRTGTSFKDVNRLSIVSSSVISSFPFGQNRPVNIQNVFVYCFPSKRETVPNVFLDGWHFPVAPDFVNMLQHAFTSFGAGAVQCAILG
jgi:hypothetical protein